MVYEGRGLLCARLLLLWLGQGKQIFNASDLPCQLDTFFFLDAWVLYPRPVFRQDGRVVVGDLLPDGSVALVMVELHALNA